MPRESRYVATDPVSPFRSLPCCQPGPPFLAVEGMDRELADRHAIVLWTEGLAQLADPSQISVSYPV